MIEVADSLPTPFFPCFLRNLMTSALKDAPVVMLTRLRECGKTTLVRNLIGDNRDSANLGR